MFTGLIETVGTIARTARRGRGLILTIACRLPLNEISLGESIAVDGVCLTATGFTENGFLVDVSPETAKRSTLGSKTSGTAVNLERALRPTDRLGGHFVTGHIDGIARVSLREDTGDFTHLVFAAEATITKYIVEKGSVSVDGISLTVNEASPASFSVTVIPHTLEATTLGSRKEGDTVNIENDILGKYVEKFLAHSAKPSAAVTKEFLAKHNFI